MQAKSTALEGLGRASLAIYRASKVPKELPDAREPSHLGNVGQHCPLVAPTFASYTVLAIGGTERYAAKLQEDARREGLLFSVDGSGLLLIPALNVDHADCREGFGYFAAARVKTGCCCRTS